MLRGVSAKQQVAKFRSPDYLVSPSYELKVLSKNRYEKISGSREMGLCLDFENFRSDSFRHLIQGVRHLERELLSL